MGKYRHNTNGSTELVLVKQNFLLRGIRDSRTLIVIGAMHGLVVSILVIRNFAFTEFALARLHCSNHIFYNLIANKTFLIYKHDYGYKHNIVTS